MPRLPVVPADISIVSDGDDYILRIVNAMALYTYDRDPAGESTCLDECAMTWPPVVPPIDATPVGDWTIITRSDSSRQWAFHGQPVYTYAKDEPGQTNGDGIGGLWHLIRF